MKIPWTTLGALAGIALILPGTSQALETLTRDQPIKAEIKFTESSVLFQTGKEYQNFTLIITGPANYQAEVSSRGPLPEVSLRKFGVVTDGIFDFHMTAATSTIVKILNPGLNNGRDDIPTTRNVAAALSGKFCVKGGVIVPLDDTPEDRQKGDNDD